MEDTELKDFINKLRNEEIHGINVTVPFKNKVIKYLDKLSLEVETTGIDVTGHITASANISASGTIIGNLVPQVPKVEYLNVTSSALVADTVMNLPNSLTYVSSSGGYEYLEIFSDGTRLSKDIDYAEVSTSSVRFLTPIPSASVITYKSLRLE